MKISKRKRAHKESFTGPLWIITLDGKEYTVCEVAKVLGLQEIQVKNACYRKSARAFSKFIPELVWKIKKELPIGEGVSYVAGKMVTSSWVASKVGITLETSRGRIQKALKHNQSYDYLMRPREEKQVTAREARVKYHEPDVPNELGMGPRRKASELGRVGSWEQKLPQPKDGCGTTTLGHVCGTSSTGTCMRGD